MSQTQETEKIEEIQISESDFVDSIDPHTFSYPLRFFEDLKCVDYYEKGEFVRREWEGDTNYYEKVVDETERLYPKGFLSRSDDRFSSNGVLSSCRSIEDVFNQACLVEFPLT